MRAKQFIVEIVRAKKKRKKKRSKAKPRVSKYYYPGFGYYGFAGSGESQASGGDGGGGGESINESAVSDLAKKLPGLKKHDYNSIDRLMRKIAARHKISAKSLHDLWVKKYKKTPDDWIKGKLDESTGLDMEDEVNKFCEWVCQKINLKTKPDIELSYDTEEAREGHHTGRHIMNSNHIWIYANNRNLVDILRTVAHELTHLRQGELNMIEPGDSYPGSPIEMLADMVAGKLIKIYGKKNKHIFQ